MQVHSPDLACQLHRAVSVNLAPGASSDRRICPQHVDNNPVSSACKAEGHTNTPSTRNRACGQPAMLPC